MSDTPYTNSRYQIKCLREALQGDVETLNAGIHDSHDRHEIEEHVKRLRTDIIKLEEWEAGRIRLTTQTEAADESR